MSPKTEGFPLGWDTPLQSTAGNCQLGSNCPFGFASPHQICGFPLGFPFHTTPKRQQSHTSFLAEHLFWHHRRPFFQKVLSLHWLGPFVLGSVSYPWPRLGVEADIPADPALETALGPAQGVRVPKSAEIHPLKPKEPEAGGWANELFSAFSRVLGPCGAAGNGEFSR